jgi:hypothetical protein
MPFMAETSPGPLIESRIYVIRGHKVLLDQDGSLRSQFATSNEGRGGRRYLPYAFTELGIAMLSSVLRSPRAI